MRALRPSRRTKKLGRRAEQLPERRVDVEHVRRWVAPPQRAVEIERVAVELGVEPDAELQLVDVALEDVALHGGDELEIAIAIDRVAHRTGGGEGSGQSRLRCEQSVEICLDATLAPLRVFAGGPNRKHIGKVVEDQPR